MFRTVFTVSFLLAILTACAGPTDAIIGQVDPRVDLEAVEGLTKQVVYVATSRQATDEAGLLFSGERGAELGFARFTVTIPPDHKTGAIERPERAPADPRSEFAIVDPTVFSGSKPFVNRLSRELRSRPPANRDVLLFVHGFNTTLTEAVLRAAQFAHDSGFTGVPVVFSWASRGSNFDYVYDLNSVLIARDKLIEAGLLILEASPSGVDFVAHSMGNFLTMEVMRQASLQGRFNASRKFRDIILASPDIDVNLFETQLKGIPRSQRNFYVLISANDKALGISKFLAGDVPRVGDADPERLADLGVTVVDLSEVKDTSSIHHSKFADVPEVVQLIGRHLESGSHFETSTTASNVPANVVQSIANVPITIFGGQPRSVGLQ
ncbi:alpha/beta hydrolase [Labrenzia sp. PHM005]|uniref:alpha/beta hydrolase n=1 Tax=Labrenzia sp. PHM005 TaxID=2590016 RepID=UPI00143D0DAD|nr:alpha/beta hydrolase [Labrenzia sp. PHM005]